MKIKTKKSGSALLITVFVVALLATLAAGMLNLAAEETQLAQNQIYAAQAKEIAEAGLNDAMSQIRINRLWDAGFSAKPFGGGSYTVSVNNSSMPNIVIGASGVNAYGYSAVITAEATIGDTAPYLVRIDKLKVNR